MTSFEVRGNPNYSAWIAEVLPGTLIDLPNCDNVVGFYTGGYQAIVPKSTQEGDILVVFPAESQLSDEFLRSNNLYRHSERNADPTIKGYVEDNRRVKALKFRGNRSDALALPVDNLLGIKTESEREPLLSFSQYMEGVKPGIAFDTINGIEICRKYELPVKVNTSQAKSAAEKAFKRVDAKMLPEHIDTENYFRNAFKLADDDYVTVTQKLHGTSIRLGNVLVRRQLSWIERLANKWGLRISEYEYDYVFGSRKAIKDPHNPRQDHFYDYDLWSEEGKKYEHLIPRNMVLYGELIGWTKDGSAIQKGYTYNVPVGEAHLYIYRVAFVGSDGGLYDMSWEGVKEFCRDRNLRHVPELWAGKHSEFVAEDWLDTTYHGLTFPQAVPLAPESPVDEGVVVRREGVLPFVLKAKSPIFLGHETALLDDGVEALS